VADRVAEVDAASAVVPVEGAGLRPSRISSVFQVRIEDASIDLVELLRDEKGVVLGLDGEVRLSELDQSSLTERHDEERPPRQRDRGGRTAT
jgi:hypothetical protein